MNATAFPYQSPVIQRCLLGVTAVKAGPPDMYTTAFQGATRDLGGGGWKERARVVSSSFPGLWGGSQLDPLTVVQPPSCVWLFATRWTAARQAPCPSLSPGICSNSSPLSRWCHPTTSSSVAPLLSLPSVFPSIRVFSNESALHTSWRKYWSFSFSVSPSNE